MADKEKKTTANSSPKKEWKPTPRTEKRVPGEFAKRSHKNSPKAMKKLK